MEAGNGEIEPARGEHLDETLIEEKIPIRRGGCPRHTERQPRGHERNEEPGTRENTAYREVDSHPLNCTCHL